MIGSVSPKHDVCKVKEGTDQTKKAVPLHKVAKSSEHAMGIDKGAFEPGDVGGAMHKNATFSLKVTSTFGVSLPSLT